MKRREFITLVGGATAWPHMVRAQQTGKLPTIGYFGPTTPSVTGQRITTFVERLRELGWIEGRTVTIEYRWGEGQTERFAEIAAELVRLKVDIIFTASTEAVLAAKQATAIIPIVFSSVTDPVGTGLVATLARPGGNATGLSVQLTDTAGKRLELLRELIPGLRRLAIMVNVNAPGPVLETDEVRTAARTLGFQAVTSEIRKADDIAPAFEALKGRVDTLYVTSDPLMNTNRVRINTLALGARLPTMYGNRAYLEGGGLMSYGTSYADLDRRAAEFVDKILRGVKPADIPVEQPTKFELVINLQDRQGAWAHGAAEASVHRRRGDRVKRRSFLTLLGGAAAAWPKGAWAQQPGVPVIGFLDGQSFDPNLISAFREVLKDAGYIEGRNVAIYSRSADSQTDRLVTLAGDIVGRRVAVVVTTGGAAALAVFAATTTIPIVFVSGADPVASGLVMSLNRPSSNATGVYIFQQVLEGKRLELLHGLAPAAALIAVLLNPTNANFQTQLRGVQDAARALGQQVSILSASTERDIDLAFATVAGSGARALLVGSDPFFNSERDQVVALAARHAIPAIYEGREFVMAGGLASYGTSLADAYRQAGIYVGRLLKGEKPADLPVVQSTKFEFVINLKTAKALGLDVPPGLSSSADGIIE